MPLIGDLRQAARLYGEGSRRAPLSPNAPPFLVVAAYHPQSGKSQRALCSSNHNTYKLHLEEYKVAGRIQSKYYYLEYITHSHLNFTNALKPTTLVSRDQCHLGRPSRRISLDSIVRSTSSRFNSSWRGCSQVLHIYSFYQVFE